MALAWLNPLEWIKRFPHPEYGHFGGFYNRRATWNSNLTAEDDKQRLYPIDELDQVFHDHDEGKLSSWGLVKGCIKAKNFKRPVWGRVYKWLAAGTFLIPSIWDHKDNG